MPFSPIQASAQTPPVRFTPAYRAVIRSRRTGLDHRMPPSAAYVLGASADIGAFEFDPDRLFANVFE
jgi:hypothetical protein